MAASSLAGWHEQTLTGSVALTSATLFITFDDSNVISMYFNCTVSYLHKMYQTTRKRLSIPNSRERPSFEQLSVGQKCRVQCTDSLTVFLSLNLTRSIFSKMHEQDGCGATQVPLAQLLDATDICKIALMCTTPSDADERIFERQQSELFLFTYIFVCSVMQSMLQTI